MTEPIAVQPWTSLAKGPNGEDLRGCALRVDLTLYALEAVLRAAYKLTERFHLLLSDHQPGRSVVASIWPKGGGGVPDFDPAALAGRFADELLEQSLRLLLEEKTSAVRDLIVAQAFAEGNLLDPQREEGDFDADPLSIADFQRAGAGA